MNIIFGGNEEMVRTKNFFVWNQEIQADGNQEILWWDQKNLGCHHKFLGSQQELHLSIFSRHVLSKALYVYHDTQSYNYCDTNLVYRCNFATLYNLTTSIRETN